MAVVSPLLAAGKSRSFWHEIDAQSLTTTIISGGSVTSLFAAYGGSATITGGSVADIFVQNNSVSNIKGGKIGRNTIRIFDTANVNLFGTGLDFASSGSGSDAYGSYLSYILSGSLNDGESMNGVNLFSYTEYVDVAKVGDRLSFTASGNASVAAPEPGTLALALFPFLSIIACHHKKPSNNCRTKDEDNRD